MPDNIEQARAALARAEFNGAPVGNFPTLMALADAYALAVLREVRYHGGPDSEYHCAACRKFEPLSLRIEALGTPRPARRQAGSAP